MKKIKKSKVASKLVLAILLLVIPMLISLSALTTYSAFYFDRIYPNTYISSINVSGMTKPEALTSIDKLRLSKVTIQSSENVYDILPSEIGLTYNSEQTIDNAFSIHRNQGILLNISNRISSLFKTTTVPFDYRYDKNKLTEFILVVSEQIEVAPVYPEVMIANDTIQVNKGVAGIKINKDKLVLNIDKNISDGIKNPISIPTEIIDPSISSDEALVLEERAKKLIGKNIVFEIEKSKYTYNDLETVKLLSSDENYSKIKSDEMIAKLITKVERPAQNPVFEFSEGKVKEFKPAIEGYTLDKNGLSENIFSALSLLEATNQTEATISVNVIKTQPDIQTGEVNDLGIKELLGVGTSTFKGSIPNRIHNVGLASSKFNGVLVKPNEVFSFNAITGDISVLTGYKQAYIIQDGKTILGDGGGVCQVSTTLFRAVLNAGLPITERRAHSYRVTYYEQGFDPGIDATVFSPTTDFKFKNDTPAHLLIQTYYDAKNTSLKFEIYGTSDGRVAKITKPVISSQSPPPEPLYQDDPTLPLGQVKQIDWSAWGAKVYFDYEVTRNGEIIYEKTFTSNYKPWQAKYLRGTKPL